MDRRGAALTRRDGRSSGLVTGALLVAPVAFFVVFFALPVAAITGRGLVVDGVPDVAPIADLVLDEGLRNVAWFTFWQAAVSTAATVAMALPMAFVLARLAFRGKSLVRALIVVPFVLPTIVVGTAFLTFLGPDGPVAAAGSAIGIADVDLRQSVPGIVVAHVFFNYAVIARTVGGAWARLDPSVEEAARTLGASPWQTFRWVTLPAIGPTITAAAAVVFLFSFTSFGVIKVLGGPRIATIEVEIHRLTTDLLDLRGAAALSLLQMATVVALLVFVGRVPRGIGQRPARFASAGRDADRAPRGLERPVLGLTLASATLLLGAPMASLADRSVSTESGYSLAFYRSLSTTGQGTTGFVPPTEAIANSIRFGLQATAIALVVGVCASVAIVRLGRRTGGLADAALTLPLGTSAVTVGFGFLIALDTPPLDLRTSPLLIPAAQALIATPFVIRSLLPAIRAVDPRFREAAATLGAGTGRTAWEIDMRLLVSPLLVAAGFALAISLGEFGATVFIARADAPTVPVAIFRALAKPGALNVGQAMAMSTILMVMTAMVMLVVDRLRSADEVGSFA